MFVSKKGAVNWKVLLVIAFIVLALALYFTLVYTYKCDDNACFQAHQEKCADTKFTSDTTDAIWFYEIRGKYNGECKIDVRLVQVKEGKLNLRDLEGLEMSCDVPLGSIIKPESNLQNCHGILKEELQAFIINKLHSYIIDNVGEIGEELTNF